MALSGAQRCGQTHAIVKLNYEGHDLADRGSRAHGLDPRVAHLLLLPLAVMLAASNCVVLSDFEKALFALVQGEVVFEES